MLASAETEMLPTYFQTQTSIISFHLQSFNRAGTLKCSTGKTKKMKKNVVQMPKSSPSKPDQVVLVLLVFFVVLSLLHRSSRAFHIPSKVYCSLLKICSSKQPHSLNSGRQRNTTSAAALSWAEPKHTSGFAIFRQACQCLANACFTVVKNAHSPPQ